MRFALLMTVIALGTFQLISVIADQLQPLFVAGGYL